MSNMASKVDGFGLGVNVSGDIEMSLELRTTTEQDAQQFHDMIQGFIAMAKASDQQPEAKEFLDKLRLSRDGRILAAQMSISQADIERQLAQARPTGSAGWFCPGTTAAGAAAAPQAPLRRHPHLWPWRKAPGSTNTKALTGAGPTEVRAEVRYGCPRLPWPSEAPAVPRQGRIFNHESPAILSGPLWPRPPLHAGPFRLTTRSALPWWVSEAAGEALPETLPSLLMPTFRIWSMSIKLHWSAPAESSSRFKRQSRLSSATCAGHWTTTQSTRSSWRRLTTGMLRRRYLVAMQASTSTSRSRPRTTFVKGA